MVLPHATKALFVAFTMFFFRLQSDNVINDTTVEYPMLLSNNVRFITRAVVIQ